MDKEFDEFKKKVKKTAEISEYIISGTAGELKTEKDLERYKSILEFEKGMKLKYRRNIDYGVPRRGVCALLLFMFSMIQAEKFTDKVWLALVGSAFVAASFWYVTAYTTYRDDYAGLRDSKKEIRFLKKAIREYESKKVQQSNTISDVLTNTK